MPLFQSHEGAADWAVRTQPRNTWWTRFKDRFQKNLVGGYITAHFREWVYYPIYHSFTRGPFTRKLHADSGRSLGRLFQVPLKKYPSGTESYQEAYFLPVEPVFGHDYAAKVMDGIRVEMQKRQRELQAHLARQGIARTGAPRPGDNKGQKLLDKYREYADFLREYEKHQSARRQFADAEGRAHALGEELGVGAFYEGQKPLEYSEQVRDPRTGRMVTKKFGGMPMVPSPNVKKKKNIVYFGGRYYTLGVGEGTTIALYEEARPASLGRRIVAAIRDWREWNRSTSHVRPPDSMWNFHFNLFENRYIEGESPKDWFERTMGNTQKALSDEAGRTFIHKMYVEAALKRWYRFGVSRVSGELLARAMKEYSHDFGGLIPEENIPGYGRKESVPLAALGIREVLAVTAYMVGHGLPSSRIKTTPELSPKRAGELLKEYDELTASGKNRKRLKMIEDSIRDRKDYVGEMERASLTVRQVGSRISPHTNLIIMPDGTIDLAKVEVTRDGSMRTHMPLGSKPFYVQRWNIPTLTNEGLAVMEYLSSYKPFVERIVNMGKAQDTTLGQLLYEQRQPLKALIMQYTHDGSLDDGSDLAIKLAAAFGLGSHMANEFYLVLHEQANRWAGTELDHMRRQVNNLLLTLDDMARLFYFSEGVDTENVPAARADAYKARGQFLFKVASDYEVMSRAKSVHQNREYARVCRIMASQFATKGEVEKAEKLIQTADQADNLSQKALDSMADELMIKYGDDVAVQTHDVEHKAKRIRKLATWLVTHAEVFNTFFIRSEELKVMGHGQAVIHPNWVPETIDSQKQTLPKAA